MLLLVSNSGKRDEFVVKKGVDVCDNILKQIIYKEQL